MGDGNTGYAFGATDTARSPLSLEGLDMLRAAVTFSPADERALRAAGEVLADQVDELLEVWYSHIADHPHLLHYFSDPDTGEPIEEYLERVSERFAQWILDTCRRPYDEAWLDYQEEIALRHTRAKKNATDGVRSVSQVPLRYLICFIYPIVATVRDFLASKGASPDEVDAMHQAWFKSVTLQVALWSRPYAGSDW